LTTSTRLSSIIAPAFRSLHKSIKRGEWDEVWCKGGRGSTKSTFISAQVFLALARDPQAHAFISRRYDNELRDSVYGQMQWTAAKLGIDSVWRFMTSPMQAVNVLTGQKILFRGVDNPIKAKSINLGFGYIKVFWAEEVDQYGSMEELRTILQSLFRGEGSGQIAFFSYNPPKSARAWVNAETKTPKPRRVVHSSDYRTVPPHWLGERFLADAAHLAKVNPDAYRHEYLGEEIGTGLEVFGNVTIRPVTAEERATNIRQGLDFGYAIDPVAFLRMSFDRKRRRLYIFREVYGIGIGNRKLFSLLFQEEQRTMTMAESAEPKSIAELKEYGMNIRAVKKGPGSVEHGIKWLAELEEIVIDPSDAPAAAKEFTNYALAMNRQGEVISRYPDENNHAIDATRYACVDDIKTVSVPSTNIRALAGI
jgi:phage terminase large subunit